MRNRKIASSKKIAADLVEPGRAALRGLNGGMVGMQDAINLQMIGELSRKAATSGLTVPDITLEMSALANPVIVALKTDGKVVFEAETLDQAEQALRRLQGGFAKISTFKLAAFIDQLVLFYDIKQLARAEIA